MNLQALIDIMPLMGKGFGGVFLVIILIWISIAALARFCK